MLIRLKGTQSLISIIPQATFYELFGLSTDSVSLRTLNRKLHLVCAQNQTLSQNFSLRTALPERFLSV